VEVNIAVDTNAYSDFMRGHPSRVDVMRTARQIHMPLFVLGELRAGFAAGKKESTNAANLQRFLGSSRVSILLPDDQTTHHFAQLYLQLRKKAVAIPTNDLWIAALAVQHSLILCTSDPHFKHLPLVPTC
jgi:tRNA(fMet)-specific endonuclease VapC